MYLTVRTLYFLLLLAPLVFIFQGLLTPAGSLTILNGLFFTAVLIDYFLTPGREKLRFTRIMDEKLSLGAENPIEFQVWNLSKISVFLQMKDEIPEEFKTTERLLSIQLTGLEKKGICYKTIPTRRGEYHFGQLHIRALGVLGLAGKQFKVDVEKDIKVYPNIREISRYKLIARKGRLAEAGLKPVKIYGVGTDFESLREYQPDDEFRKINWKATARLHRLVTSQYEHERSQNIFLVLEAGRMMTSKIDGITKLDYAINAALLLGYVAMEKGDNVGVMVFSDEVKTFIPCKRGKKHLYLIIESLYKQEPQRVEPDYKRAIRYLSLKNRKRSLTVLFTDLIDTDVSRAVVKYARALYPAHLPLCAALSDPELFEASDMTPDSLRSVYKRAVAEDLILQREQVKNVLEKGGVMTLDVNPKNLTPSLIAKYLSIKARTRL